MRNFLVKFSLVIALLSLILLPTFSFAAGPTTPLGAADTQAYPILNKFQASSANTSQTITLTGIPGTSIHIYSIYVVPTGAAATCTVTITDNAVTVFTGNSLVATAVGTTVSTQFRPAWTISQGKTATIVVSACGASSVSNLTVQADAF